jgi:nitroreductase
MEAREARAILLRQHEDLRNLLERIAAAATAGAPVADMLAALRVAFADHNVTEERLLEPILRLDYAWGPPRIQRMLEEHAAEHTVMRGLLGEPGLAGDERLVDLIEEIEAHMAAEERTFLGASVLRDDYTGQGAG